MRKKSRRPRRALLFVPGTEPRKMEKAAGVPADGVILDLEDSVAPSKKEEARVQTASALARIDFGRRERIVRINAVGTGLEGRDLEAVLAGPSPPESILVPKVESDEQVRMVAGRLDAAERRLGLPAGRIRIMALVETARGVVELRAISRSSDRLEALFFGAEDLMGDVGGVRTQEGREVLAARSMVAIHAAAEGLHAIDTPFVDLADLDRLARETREALELGYNGKQAIHPKQLEPILEVLTPREEEIQRAERLLSEYESHRAEGRGVFQLDGRMVDVPIMRAAEHVVERARLAGLRP